MKGSITERRRRHGSGGVRAGAFVAPALAALLCLPSCGGSPEGAAAPQDSAEIVAQVGDSVLTFDDLRARIPQGLDPADSLRLASNIADSWLRDVLLASVAEENVVDLEHIDRLTEEFRNDLIVGEYMKRYQAAKPSKASDAEARRFYDANAGRMLLERPLVKGILIKVPADARGVEQLRRWMKSASASSVASIEKYGLGSAMQYDYFMDRWVDFSDVAAAIPYRFETPDDFVSRTDDFETQRSGALYILHISDRKLSGDTMPYDFARPQILQALEQQERSRYADALMADLCARARKRGVLKTPGYDPKTHKLIINNPKK